mmetsp:Transcript_45818/g.95969  ORF Transcript_45818/g.95969 Transcript_45818/m.95969 type:complete len:238 (+) Transcript_45818:257-970(+)
MDLALCCFERIGRGWSPTGILRKSFHCPVHVVFHPFGKRNALPFPSSFASPVSTRHGAGVMRHVGAGVLSYLALSLAPLPRRQCRPVRIALHPVDDGAHVAVDAGRDRPARGSQVPPQVRMTIGAAGGRGAASGQMRPRDHRAASRRSARVSCRGLGGTGAAGRPQEPPHAQCAASGRTLGSAHPPAALPGRFSRRAGTTCHQQSRPGHAGPGLGLDPSLELERSQSPSESQRRLQR